MEAPDFMLLTALGAIVEYCESFLNGSFSRIVTMHLR